METQSDGEIYYQADSMSLRSDCRHVILQLDWPLQSTNSLTVFDFAVGVSRTTLRLKVKVHLYSGSIGIYRQTAGKYLLSF